MDHQWSAIWRGNAKRTKTTPRHTGCGPLGKHWATHSILRRTRRRRRYIQQPCILLCSRPPSSAHWQHRHSQTSEHAQWFPRCQLVLARLNLALRGGVAACLGLANLRIASHGRPSIGARVDLWTCDLSRLIQGKTIGATTRLGRVTTAWSITIRCSSIYTSRCKARAAVALRVVFCSCVREVLSKAIISALLVGHFSISDGRSANCSSNIAIAPVSPCKLKFAKREKEDAIHVASLICPAIVQQGRRNESALLKQLGMARRQRQQRYGQERSRRRRFHGCGLWLSPMARSNKGTSDVLGQHSSKPDKSWLWLNEREEGNSNVQLPRIRPSFL